MLNVEKHFAQTIAVGYYENDDDYMKSLQDKCFELEETTPKGGFNWLSAPYNTSNTLDLYSIPEFDKLNKWVDRQVADYLDIIGYKHEFPNKEQAWFNIYRKGDFQEFHHHGSCVVSAIFILKAGDENTKVSFDNTYTDMIYSDTPTSISYISQDYKLIIFRSYMKHAVGMHQLDEPRISLAYNYKRIIK